MKIDNRSNREKSLEEMTLEEQVNYWTGHLIISIGSGQFRNEVVGMILCYLNNRKHRKPKGENHD